MSGRITAAVQGTASFFVNLGSGLRGVAAPLRAKSGAFGTQRMESAQLDEQRRTSYPRD